MDRRAWLIVLGLYGLVACGDFAYHWSVYVRGADGATKYTELPVAYSAALFWPVDLVAIALLKML